MNFVTKIMQSAEKFFVALTKQKNQPPFLLIYMKIIPLTLLLLFFHYSAFAFPNEESEISLPEFSDLSESNHELEQLLQQAWSLRNSHPERSLQFGLQAISMADSLQDHYNLLKAYSFTGVAYRLLGDYSNAIDFFFTGLALSKEYNIPQQEGYAHINIANLYIYLEYYTNALDNLNQALEIAQKINDNDMLSYVLLNKGRVLMHLEEYTDAIKNIRESLELRKKAGNLPGQAVCYKYLGDIYFARDHFDQAILNYDLALETINPEEDRHLYGNLFLRKAQMQSMRSQLDSAGPFATKALEIGREVNSRLLIKDALKVQADVDMHLGDYRSAAYRLKEMTEYADTLFNQQLAEKVLSIEFQWEREKRQAEMDILERDKEIQSLRINRQRAVNYLLIIATVVFLAVGLILFILLNKLKSNNIELTRQKEELRQVNQAKDKMFMVIGHDLRGPVWNIKALIELIREDLAASDTASLNESFSALQRSVQAVNDLLENLLFWAKSQDGNLVFKPKTLDMQKLISTTIDLYNPMANHKNIAIEFNPDELCTVIADENMISAVIRNLLSNAIKYSLKEGRIEISMEKDENYCTFRIKDHGVGMSEEVLKNIFDREKSISTRGTGNEAGSGIGLGLCRDFVQKHGGKIWAESKPGKGTEFFFSLPQ